MTARQDKEEKGESGPSEGGVRRTMLYVNYHQVSRGGGASERLVLCCVDLSVSVLLDRHDLLSNLSICLACLPTWLAGWLVALLTQRWFSDPKNWNDNERLFV